MLPSQSLLSRRMRAGNTPESVPVEESDHCQVRAAGREDFVLPPSRGDPEDGVDDVGIRDQDTGERDHS